MRTCSDCGISKDGSEFYARQARCKPCHNKRSKDYRAENPGAEKNHHRAYYLANAERIRETALARRAADVEKARALSKRYRQKERAKELQAIRTKRWLAANPERAKTQAAASRARYPERLRENCRRRRARLRGAITEPVDYRAIRVRDGDRCYLCGLDVDEAEIEFDHVIPLSRGGAHSHANVRVTHRTCNRRKWARTPEELLTSQTQRGAA